MKTVVVVDKWEDSELGRIEGVVTKIFNKDVTLSKELLWQLRRIIIAYVKSEVPGL